MQKTTRRKVFFLFVAVFFLAAPTLIGYALGYTFDITRRELTRTGGIFIKSSTPAVTVFLDGNFAKETSFISGGALLTDVPPGDHALRVERAGYGAWTKTVRVEETIVTEYRNVILAANPLPVATTTKEDAALLRETKPLGPNLSINKKKNLVEKGRAGEKILAANVHSFTFINDTIYFVNNDGFLAQIAYPAKELTTIDRPGFFISEKPIRFFPSPSGDIFLIDPVGGLYLLAGDARVQTIASDVQNVVFDEDGSRVLLIKERGIDLLWRESNTYQPFQRAGTLEPLVALRNTVKEAAWFYNDNVHVVYRTGDGIFLTEIDGRGGRNTVELEEGPVDALKTFPTRPRSIFFQKEKTWFTVEI